MTKEDNNELRRKIEELSNTLKEVENNDKNVIKEQRYFVLNQFYTLTHTHTFFSQKIARLEEEENRIKTIVAEAVKQIGFSG